MAVKSNFRKYIDEFFNDLTLYDDRYNGHKYKDLLKASIDVFLDNESSYSAYDIYRIFFMIYQITYENKSAKKDIDENGEVVIEKAPVNQNLIHEQNVLLDLVSIMKGYEENTGDLIEKQRDHFIHSVNVFLLGLAIYSQNYTYRDIFYDYITEAEDKKYQYEKYYKIDDEFSREEFLYRWGIASLFHDIGYPVEIIANQLKKFVKDGIQPISPEYSVDMGIDFRDFDEFNHILEIDPNFTDDYIKNWDFTEGLNFYKPTDIMAHKISREFGIDINKLKGNLDNFVNIMNENGFIDHGFFSSILVMDSYGYLIQNYTKDSDFFFYPIADSATAILLHNYYRGTLTSDHYDFNLGPMCPHDNPLAYLLILCDELQEWNRQPFGVKDKQRDHVNELELFVDDEDLYVRYIIKHGSMGLDFSSEKKSLLGDLLNIKAIFSEGLRVKTDIDKKDKTVEENAMRNIVKSDIHAPEVLARNIEKLAIEIHNNYNETVETQYFDLLKKVHKDSSFEKEQERLSTTIGDLKYKSWDYEEGDPIFNEIAELETEFDEIKNGFKAEALNNLPPEYEEFAGLHKEYLKLEESLSEFEKTKDKEIFNTSKWRDYLETKEKYENISYLKDIISKMENDESKYTKTIEEIMDHPKWTEYWKTRIHYEKIGELNNISSKMSDIEKKYDGALEKLDKDNPDRVEYQKLNEMRDALVSEGINIEHFNGLQFYDFKKKYDERRSFDELSSQFKMSNIRQARSIPKKLAMIGCELAHKDDERDEVLEFLEDEVNDLAILEHDDWCEEREGTGWILGPKKDEENLITPYLVPWTDLDPEIQEYDKDPVRKIPSYARAVGLKVVRTRIRLLTIEMHKNYEKSKFEDLPNYVKYSNYKYTDFLVKNLAQEGYRFVPVEEDGDPVESFKDELVTEICKKEHENWVDMRERLGWSRGSKKDDEKKTNPNLVPWERLRPNVKKANKKTIERLPEFCETVGLKIVKDK